MVHDSHPLEHGPFVPTFIFQESDLKYQRYQCPFSDICTDGPVVSLTFVPTFIFAQRALMFSLVAGKYTFNYS